MRRPVPHLDIYGLGDHTRNPSSSQHSSKRSSEHTSPPDHRKVQSSVTCTNDLHCKTQTNRSVNSKGYLRTEPACCRAYGDTLLIDFIVLAYLKEMPCWRHPARTSIQHPITSVRIPGKAVLVHPWAASTIPSRAKALREVLSRETLTSIKIAFDTVLCLNNCLQRSRRFPRNII